MSEMYDENLVESSAEATQQHQQLNQASAPPADENNGFEQIEHNEIENANVENAKKLEEEEMNKLINDMSSRITNSTTVAPVVPEEQQKPKVTETAKPQELPTSKSCESKKICAACPYSFLGGSCLSKINLPPKVKDLVLWKCPKGTGAVFGTVLVLLISLSLFSLLTVISTLLLLAMISVGTYRLYLAIVFRIKGTYDETFDKASAFDLSLPNDKIQQIANFLETNINQSLNKLKSIILWDNIATSAISFVGFYVVYCVGSVFNTLTLLILIHVSLFSLPKVYETNKVQIDQGFEKAADFGHQLARQIQAKIPPSVSQFLHKRKAD